MRNIRSTRSLSIGAEKDGSVVLVGSIEFEFVLASEHDDDDVVNGSRDDGFLLMAPVPDAKAPDETLAVAS